MASSTWPRQPTDNKPFPAGYASIKAALDKDAIESQSMEQDSYYFNAKSDGREHDIEEGDLVFAITSYRKESAKDKLYGMPRVRASFNGLGSVPGMALKFKQIKAEMGASSDSFIQDLVSTHLQILGVAFDDHRYERNKDHQLASFAVQIAGIAQLVAHDYMPIGALAKAQPPQFGEWTSSSFKRKRSADYGKIPLIVTAVHPEDISNFALRVMYRYIFLKEYLTTDKFLKIAGDGRVQAEQQFAQAMAKFALLSGVNFVKHCMRYDLLAPVPLGEDYNPAPGQGRPVAGDADLFHKREYRDFISTPRQRYALQQNGSVKPEHRRQALGHLLWYSTPGPNAVRYPVQEGENSGNYNVRKPLLPEEAVTVIAKGVGIMGPNNITQTDSKDFNRTDEAPHRGEWMAAVLASDTTLGPERNSFRQLTDEFLRSMFISQHHDKTTSNTRYLEFGDLDYNNPNARKHIGRVQSQSTSHIYPIDRRTHAGLLLSKQVNATFDVVNGLQNITNVFRGRIVGRVTKSAEPGRMCEVMLNTAM